jgi:hypothetical protein
VPCALFVPIFLLPGLTVKAVVLAARPLLLPGILLLALSLKHAVTRGHIERTFDHKLASETSTILIDWNNAHQFPALIAELLEQTLIEIKRLARLRRLTNYLIVP